MRLPVGGSPGGSSGPVLVPLPNQSTTTKGKCGWKNGPSARSTRASGNGLPYAACVEHAHCCASLQRGRCQRIFEHHVLRHQLGEDSAFTGVEVGPYPSEDEVVYKGLLLGCRWIFTTGHLVRNSFLHNIV